MVARIGRGEVVRSILPSLRHAPHTVALIILLEIVKSDLFRPVDGQSVDVTLGPRQAVEIALISLCFVAQIAQWRGILRALRGLPRTIVFALTLYFATIAISILTSLNAGLSVIRAAEGLPAGFSYVSVALVWGANIAAARPDDFMPTLWAALLTLCRFLVGLQVCVALAHARDAGVVDLLKSNSYSIVCAALFALTARHARARAPARARHGGHRPRAVPVAHLGAGVVGGLRLAGAGRRDPETPRGVPARPAPCSGPGSSCSRSPPTRPRSGPSKAWGSSWAATPSRSPISRAAPSSGAT